MSKPEMRTYRCSFGCTSYNPNCDGCDSATTSDNSYERPNRDKDRVKAANTGMTLQEWDAQEESGDE